VETIPNLLEQRLRQIIDQGRFTPKLHAAISHSQLPPGKMIRGVLSLTLCKDLGGEPTSVLSGAAALEFLHTSSLIHDDLPAMDNDDMRRGRASCHKQFDEATAILAGDALVALANESLAELQINSDLKIKLYHSLNRAYLDLCNGQQLDLAGAQTATELKGIHKLKTASLFSTAFEFGGIFAGLPAGALVECRRIGEILGISFQIVDDYLDKFGEAKGRASGSDNKNDKITFDNLEDQASIRELLLRERQQIVAGLQRLTQICGRGSQDYLSVFHETFPVLESVWGKVDSL
jgi:geranylgeranyl pyrophosphate synthase